MTATEAISRIRFLLDVGGSDGFTGAEEGALKMAIAVLSDACDKPKTNGDKIRQMTDEELAEWIDNEAGCNICKKSPTQCDVDCYTGYLEWLKQEVNEDAESNTEEP